MIRDSKLSGVLHVLLHMVEADGPVTSATMATVMHTNPAVIRRILAGLRQQGFVKAAKGHGGGWQLSCDFNSVTLRDIYLALGAPTLLAIGNRSETPACMVEQAVNAVLNQAFRDAEALLLRRFSEVTLAELNQQLRQHLQTHDHTAQAHHEHHEHHAGDQHVFSGIERWRAALDDPERDKSQRPDEVIAALGLRPNDVVADIGAGTGYFALRIAATYPQVRVVAADAEQEMTGYLKAEAKRRKLANLVPVTLDPASPELPVRANLALLVNTLHHIADRVAYIQSLHKSMAPGARIAIIDYTSAAPAGPPADHRIAAAAVRDELKQAGYELAQDLKILPDQYFMIFKPG